MSLLQEAKVRRHYTVTGFVSAQGYTLLHWHVKNRMWLPPGGHIEPDEDPTQTALREVMEETGLAVELLPTSASFHYASPIQITAPVTIMVEDIPDTPNEPAHQHIDLIYFTAPSARGMQTPPNGAWQWVSADALKQGKPMAAGAEMTPAAVAEDVRVLGIAAIERAAVEERAYHISRKV